MTDEPIADVVARVLALDEKATPGPWGLTFNRTAVRIGGDCDFAILGERRGQPPANAELVANFRTDAVTLAREVARLTEENERHRVVNVLRFVNDPLWEQKDGWIADYIAREDFDAVPWRVAADVAASFARLRDGIEALRRDYEWAMSDAVVTVLDTLLAPTIEGQP